MQFAMTFKNVVNVRVEVFVLDLVDSSAPIGQYPLDYNQTAVHMAHDTAANPNQGRLKWWTVAEGYTGDPGAEVNVDPTTVINVTAGDPL